MQYRVCNRNDYTMYEKDTLYFDYFVLLAAAGRDQMMLSGGRFFWEEKTCNFQKLWYNYGTLGWDEGFVLGEVKQPDPYF